MERRIFGGNRKRPLKWRGIKKLERLPLELP
jgi:hypothetical protein